ncbi:PHD-type domain-containing protein, partial [Aphis craccivora]
TQVDNEFIINEINERNKRASNFILYNINESDSAQSDLRIAHDLNQVNMVIKSILNNSTALPSPFKNKSNPSTDHPTISVSSDRTQNERDYMLKLHVQLTMHSSKGEVGLGPRSPVEDLKKKLILCLFNRGAALRNII